MLLAAKKIWAERKLLLLLLAGSWVLRIALILRGGPLSWPDDVRYFRTNAVLEHLSRFEFGGALDAIIKYPDHTFFTVVALIPAVFRLLVVKSLAAGSSLLGLSIQTDVSSTIWIAAAVLALASVVNIALVYGLARRVGASEREGLLAAFLTACCTSTFHLTRHLVPYEISLALALTAMWVGLDERPKLTRSYLCGLLCALAFFTYNAHWPIVLIVLAVHVLRGQRWRQELLKRAAAGGLGFLTPLALLTAANILRGTELYFVGARRWGSRVVQGDFSEGWSLPWEYFWHAEHGILLVWAAGAVVVFWQLLSRNPTTRPTGSLWLAAAVAVYLLLVLGSNVLHLFVVTGRFANQMVPFLCLTAACGLAGLPGASKKFILVVGCAVALQAACNFAQPLGLTFPYEVRQRVRAEYGDVAGAMTLYSTLWRMNADGNAVLEDHQTERAADNVLRSRYVLLNGGFPFLPIKGPKEAPEGAILLKVPHVLAYFPYQYQAYNPKERAILRSTDISIRLIETRGDR